jgi:hypothetical protein
VSKKKLVSPHFIKKSGYRPAAYSSTLPNGRFVAAGTFFCFGKHGERKKKFQRVAVPKAKDKAHYLIQVSLSMLSAPGGDFDQNDTVFTDIYEIDGKFVEGPHWKGGPISGANVTYWGAGVWGHHFGDLGWVGPSTQTLPRWLLRGQNRANMGTSSIVAPVSSKVTFRLVVTGDDWAGASYFVLEL